MRKFNLKGKVAEKLRGLGPEISDQHTGDNREAAQAEGKPAEEASMSLRLRYAWRTDVGRLRKNNQDAVILGGGIFGIADGMGGHNGGEIASAGLRSGLLRETEGQKPEAEALIQAVEKVNRELWEQQEQDITLSGMGTTLTVLWPTEQEMIIGQVGDSRAYLIRDGALRQVTNDHSMVADMVRRGVLTEEQAACHPMRNYITRAVGTDESVETDITRLPRANGDRWIICSDGLYGQMSKQELEEAAKIANLEEASDRLLQLALEHGGKDNISFILLQDESVDTETEQDAEEAAAKPGPAEKDQEGETAQ